MVSACSHRRQIFLAIAILLAIKVCTWTLGYWLSRDTTRFNAPAYLGQYHHHKMVDPAALNKSRTFFELWNYADSEWYLSIAASGYPSLNDVYEALQKPIPAFRYTEHDSFLKYAFFPLYPIAISIPAHFTGLEAAAFFVTLILGLAAGVCFVCLYCVMFPDRVNSALWAMALLFLFPFSLFFNTYHAESLFLLLSLLCFLCLRLQKYSWMASSGILLCLTRPNGIFIVLPLLYAIYCESKTEERKPFLQVLAIPFGVVPYMVLNYFKMGNWLFFSTVQQSWGNPTSALYNLKANILTRGLDFFSLQFHHFHSSQLDYLMMILFGAWTLLLWLDKAFPKHLALWSTMIWIVPLISKDMMSYSRYLCVCFPVFMFLSLRLRPWMLGILVALFAGGYFWALQRIIEYNWLG